MKRNNLATRQDNAADLSFDERTQAEQALRGDPLLHATKLLEQEQFAVLRLHDIENRSLKELQELLGTSHSG
jgi:DNA-directed RNA polymerase specialized sigma24 family protein